MKYCIFGGNGFVGRYLSVELVRKGFDTVVCDLQPKPHAMIPRECEYCQVDIRDKSTFTKFFQLLQRRNFAVINLAANQYHKRVPCNAHEYFFSVNTTGTANLLEAAFEKGCRHFLQFTTDMTYGKPKYLPVDTHHPQEPFGPYGASKKAAEEVCRQYRKAGMNITIMRPRMINGPGREGILLKLFKLIDLNMPVPMIGNGRNHYQMVSVFDCVSAAVAAMDKGFPNKEYNLGSEASPDIRHLLQKVINEARSHSFVLPTPGRLVKAILDIFVKLDMPLMYKEQYMIADEEYVLDISETIKDLGWHPRYNDADMLIEAYRNYKQKGKV